MKTTVLILTGMALMVLGVIQPVPIVWVWLSGLVIFLWGWMRALRRWPL